MTIKFACVCGKHLRAGDDMAGRRSVCPRCGSPVGVPALQPTHRGTSAGPLPLEESFKRRMRRLARFADEPPAPPPAPADPVAPALPGDAGTAPPQRRGRVPLDLTAVRQLVPHKRRVLQTPARRGGTFENRWYDCFACPLRLWWRVLALAAALTVLTGCAVLWLTAADDGTESGRTLHETIGVALGAGALIVFVYAAGVFDGVLTSAVTGGVDPSYGAARNLPRALWCAVRWAVGLLAGPAVIACGAFYYWLHAGDLDVLDRIILGEMILLAVGYWMFAQLAISRTRRLRDAQPLRVAEVVHGLGYYAWLLAAVGWLLVLGHGALLLAAGDQLRESPGDAWPLIAVTWVSGLSSGLFVFRLLGVWWHRTEPRVPSE